MIGRNKPRTNGDEISDVMRTGGQRFRLKRCACSAQRTCSESSAGGRALRRKTYIRLSCSEIARSCTQRTNNQAATSQVRQCEKNPEPAVMGFNLPELAVVVGTWAEADAGRTSKTSFVADRSGTNCAATEDGAGNGSRIDTCQQRPNTT